jgi:1-deoxy-D-xylulose-5-phosphate synthase
MSISPPVGALRKYFGKLKQVKGSGTDGAFFKALGFDYTGPIDGHNLDELLTALHALKKRRGPQLLHIVTEKGHGYTPAAADPVLYHGPGKFDPTHGIDPPVAGKLTYTQVFGDWLCAEAKADKRVVAITPAMREGSGLVEFERRFPDRFFDVGIAEQHAVTFAAGLAADGLKPVVAIYSTFLQRAYDQLIHDIAIQNLPVVFAIDRAGIVGADGATHTGAFDIAHLRCIPNLTVMAPADEDECRQMLHSALLLKGPSAVRYPRGSGNGITVSQALHALPVGKGEIRRISAQPVGYRIALLAFGSMLRSALEAAEVFDATVANMRFIKPLDGALVEQLARDHDLLVTIEEGCVMGGVGSACLERLATVDHSPPVLQLGFSDRFIEHGAPEQLLSMCGLDAPGITRSIEAFLSTHDMELSNNRSATADVSLRARA